MKYIKLFEVEGEEYRIGDLVKKIKMANGDPYRFTDMIFKIKKIDKGRYHGDKRYSDTNGYFLYYEKDKENYGWVHSMQIRHLYGDERLEMDAIKYNL